MHLIFGGAYQGKLDYAKERYQLKEADIYSCSSGEQAENKLDTQIDFTKMAIDKLEEFVRHCVHSGMETKDYLEEHRSEWKDSIIICTDISAGVVPCEKDLRAWREMVGRTLMYLGKEAEEVTRVFCGIPQRIK